MDKEFIELGLKDVLLKQIEITVNNKLLRRGTLLLYSIKDFYVNFTIKNDNDEHKVFELPYPFDIVSKEIKGKQILIFDYSLNALSFDNKMLYDYLCDMPPEKVSKFYNSKLFCIFKSYCAKFSRIVS